MADETPNIGGEPPANARRDAIHVAVMPCVAGQHMVSGNHLRVQRCPNGEWEAFLELDGYSVGIVDPFLGDGHPVKPGDRFWMFLKPNSITSLRHVWTHPTIKAGGPGEGA